MENISNDQIEELRAYPVSFRLQQLRWLANLTQVEFAQLIGCTQATVSMWERGITAPSGRMISKIIKLYDLPHNFFFDLCIDRIQTSKAKTSDDSEARYVDVDFE